MKKIAVVSPFKNETFECVSRYIDNFYAQKHPAAKSLTTQNGVIVAVWIE